MRVARRGPEGRDLAAGAWGRSCGGGILPRRSPTVEPLRPSRRPEQGTTTASCPGRPISGRPTTSDDCLPRRPGSLRPIATSRLAPLSRSMPMVTKWRRPSGVTIATLEPLASLRSAVAGISTKWCGIASVSATSAYIPGRRAPSRFGTRPSVFVVRDGRIELAGGASDDAVEDARAVVARGDAGRRAVADAGGHFLGNLDEDARRRRRGDLEERRGVACGDERSDLDRCAT